MDVTTAITGILAVGLDLLQTLDLGLDDVAGQAAREIKQARTSFQVLDKTLGLLESGRLPYPARAAWIRTSHLITIITDTALALSDLQNVIDQANEDTLETIRALASRIRWLNISLTLILSILRCSQDDEAQTCSKSLDQRMSRLLLSNNALASRVQVVESGNQVVRTLASGLPLSTLRVPLSAVELFDGMDFYSPQNEPVTPPPAVVNLAVPSKIKSNFIARFSHKKRRKQELEAKGVLGA